MRHCTVQVSVYLVYAEQLLWCLRRALFQVIGSPEIESTGHPVPILDSPDGTHRYTCAAAVLHPKRQHQHQRKCSKLGSGEAEHFLTPDILRDGRDPMPLLHCKPSSTTFPKDVLTEKEEGCSDGG